MTPNQQKVIDTYCDLHAKKGQSIDPNVIKKIKDCPIWDLDQTLSESEFDKFIIGAWPSSFPIIEGDRALPAVCKKVDRVLRDGSEIGLDKAHIEKLLGELNADSAAFKPRTIICLEKHSDSGHKIYELLDGNNRMIAACIFQHEKNIIPSLNFHIGQTSSTPMQQHNNPFSPP